MDNNDKKTLIFIPKGANYIEILGHRIDGFESFEAFCEHLKKCAELEETVNRLQAENEKLKEFASSKCADCAGCTSWKCDCSNIERKAHEDFAELLKSKLNHPYIQKQGIDFVNFLKAMVDDTLKELAGEKR